MTKIQRKDDMFTQDKRLLDRIANLENFMRASTPLSASATWNPIQLGTGTQTTTTVTVPGAALGNPVTVGFSLDLQAQQLTAYVSSANTVTVVLQNATGNTIDLASGTLRVDVWKRA